MWVEELGLAAARSAVAIIAEVVTCLRYSRCVWGALAGGDSHWTVFLYPKGGVQCRKYLRSSA